MNSRDAHGFSAAALALDFETAIPNRSEVTDRATVEGYRDHLLDMRSTVRGMIAGPLARRHPRDEAE